jgi:hypothetical protein
LASRRQPSMSRTSANNVFTLFIPNNIEREIKN